MKLENTSLKLALRWVSLSVLLCLYSDHTAWAAEKVSARTLPQTGTRSTSIISNDIPEIQIPSSVFVADYSDKAARDPFFPDASYLKRSEVIDKPQKAMSKPVDDSIFKVLKVNGLGGVGDRRWAMVNHVTIYLGENAKFTVGGKSVVVECVEMGDKSVVLGIKGTSNRHQFNVE